MKKRGRIRWEKINEKEKGLVIIYTFSIPNRKKKKKKNFFLELLSRTDYFRIFTSRKLVLRFSERTHKALRLRLAPDFFKS